MLDNKAHDKVQAGVRGGSERGRCARRLMGGRGPLTTHDENKE